MISVDSYFAAYADHPGITDEHRANAADLLERVNELLTTAIQCGVGILINPATSSYVGGTKNGGWRPQDCPIGAPSSNHKRGLAVDVYDAGNELDAWLTDKLLEQFDLWREAPAATSGHWTHLQSVPPKSGRRTFSP